MVAHLIPESCMKINENMKASDSCKIQVLKYLTSQRVYVKETIFYMKGITVKSDALLLTTAIIWGFTFGAQRVGRDYVGPFTFNGTHVL
jgi:hypothetical protein